MQIVFLRQDYAIFLHVESLKEYLFFTIWVMFWNISRIYFFFFSIQNIKSNWCIISLKSFSIIFFWWKICSVSVVFIYKRFNFCYSLCRESDAALPREFFWNFILILFWCQKWSLNRGTLVPVTTIYQTECPFTVLSALFCSWNAALWF